MKRTKAEQVKRYLIFFSGPVCKLVGRQPDHQGKSGNFPYFFYSLCTQPEFPIFSGKLHHCIQFASDLSSVLLLGKNFKAEHLLQIPVSMAFGYFIDMSMILLGFVHPVSYISKSPGTSDRLSGPWRWRIYGSAGRCSYASGRVFCKSRGIPHPF